MDEDTLLGMHFVDCLQTLHDRKIMAARLYTLYPTEMRAGHVPLSMWNLVMKDVQFSLCRQYALVTPRDLHRGVYDLVESYGPITCPLVHIVFCCNTKRFFTKPPTDHISISHMVTCRQYDAIMIGESMM